MSAVGEREKRTQQRVIAFLRDALGYRYLGDWTSRPNNRNVEPDLLRGWLERRGNDRALVAKALSELEKAAALRSGETLYDANRRMYDLLRYGVKVRPAAGEQHVTVRLVDWEDPRADDFAIAEEVTVTGPNTKRPDLVLYVNGIALGVLELKRSTVSVGEGIRQNLDNQKPEFIQPFFTTVQFLMAGNETEGLRYGVIKTRAKYWLRWKEADSHPAAADNPLLRELGQLCGKERLLELVHDFIVFDAGTKKMCRHNQYFGVRAAQERVRRREGGILWHTQGSGKSLIMVWLAKWIREHIPDGRVLIITDRTELDTQIEKVFKGVSEGIHRTTSGADLVRVLNTSEERLIGSLVQKFGPGETAKDTDIESYIAEIRKSRPAGFRPKGAIFVFVDECHRTQSGNLHEAMTDLLPEATLIGFTGTPLLRGDKRRSILTFGRYIHTYKYDEAVRDGVVLDLRYEARDIDQEIKSQERIDQWFEVKTQGLSDLAKARLKQRWGTMRKVLSSLDRLRKIVADILLDIETRDRLKSGRGNAMLVSDSIYSACRLYDMFTEGGLGGKCAVITSYDPGAAGIKGEETGEGLTQKLLQNKTYRRMLAEHFNELEETAVRKVERFERDIRKRFVEQPGQLKLLIVVDKLLTGFDAPPATYLYIDKQMRDHGLFQAVCRVNRLDGEDKDYGYVIDYKDLFRSLEQSVKDYTGEAFDAYEKADVEGLLKDRWDQGRERLEEAREAVKALCEPVEPPRDTAAYLRYFCAGESGDPEQLKANEPKRVKLYALVAAFARAYANLANEMERARYSAAETQEIRAEVEHYEKVRAEVKLASGDYVDLKTYEPAMRHLLDTYIRAEDSELVSTFDDLPLVQLIVERGEEALGSLPPGIRASREATAETIENNVRRLIIDERAVNPLYYERMSRLLDEIIRERRREALDYKEYLAKITDLARKVSSPATGTAYPSTMTTAVLRALFDNLADSPEERERTALQVDRAIRSVRKADWRGNRLKEREVRNAIRSALADEDGQADRDAVGGIFEIIKAQRGD